MAGTQVDLALIQAGLAARAQRELAAQPWYQRKRNTVNAAVGGLVFLATLVASVGLDLPAWVSVVIGVIVFVGQVFGLANTPNGFTEKEAARQQEAMADPAVLELLVKALPDNVEGAVRGAITTGTAIFTPFPFGAEPPAGEHAKGE